MRNRTGVLADIGIFLAGMTAAGVLATRRKAAPPAPEDTRKVDELRAQISELERRLDNQETSSATRFGHLETRIEEQNARLAEIPTTQQIVSAMEQLLAKTMSSLDERLTTHSNTIEVLKTTVTQTDSLLERVLESLDSMHNFNEPVDAGEDALLNRPNA